MEHLKLIENKKWENNSNAGDLNKALKDLVTVMTVDQEIEQSDLNNENE